MALLDTILFKFARWRRQVNHSACPLLRSILSYVV
jgi:hypothetical protein